MFLRSVPNLFACCVFHNEACAFQTECSHFHVVDCFIKSKGDLCISLYYDDGISYVAFMLVKIWLCQKEKNKHISQAEL